MDLSGFLSVVMSAATDTNVREKLHEKNFAIITDDYLNLFNRLGFHFATVEAFLGTPENSYVSFTFYGGGAELTRRMCRVRFLSLVLQHLGFRVELKEDSITARADALEPALLEKKLDALGRLMMVSKQLGHGDALRRAGRPLLPGVHQRGAITWSGPKGFFLPVAAGFSLRLQKLTHNLANSDY